MKIAACRVDGNELLAIVDTEYLEILPPEFRDIVALATDAATRAAALASSRKRVLADSVTFHPPVVRPEKIICVWINYTDHAI